MTDDESTQLTSFQLKVARLFFTLPASAGFLLAGGAALLAQQLTHRPTQDLDFFTRPGAGDVARAKGEFVGAASRRGWSVETIQDGPSFCRLRVHGRDELIVDIALDSPPERPPVASLAGPTFAAEELAGRKLIALFDRAAARDFLDVYELASRFSKAELLARAADIDAGFDQRAFAAMLDHLNRYHDADLGLGGVDITGLAASSAPGPPNCVTTRHDPPQHAGIGAGRSAPELIRPSTRPLPVDRRTPAPTPRCARRRPGSPPPQPPARRTRNRRSATRPPH